MKKQHRFYLSSFIAAILAILSGYAFWYGMKHGMNSSGSLDFILLNIFAGPVIYFGLPFLVFFGAYKIADRLLMKLDSDKK